MSAHNDEKPHLPPPSLWPIGFAVGIACVLVGLVVSWPAVAVGAVITAVFAFLWIRDVTAGVRAPAPDVVPESRAAAGVAPAAVETALVPAEAPAYPRSKFLEGATLGLGGVIGGLVTVPVLGFAVLPSFTNQKKQNVELGKLSDFPEGKFVIATYMEDPSIGEVSRRTMYIRNNGPRDGQPSLTVLFSRCVHLGCPVQPNGPVFDEDKVDGAKNGDTKVELTPSQPAGFGCPCHGGQYDTEGNRTAGPPVRALDRAEYSIKNGSVWLGPFYSVSHVEGQGAQARIRKFGKSVPGVHVDGIESWLYPIPVPGS